MKTTKHTPGPWSTEYDGSIVMNRQIVSGPIAPESADWEERRANARLIAAAPDMLMALKSAEQCAVDSNHPDFDPEECRCDQGLGWCEGCTLVEIRAAIARAEGGAK